MSPTELSTAGLATFTMFCKSSGVSIELTQSAIWQRVAFLGLSGSPPMAENGWRLEAHLPTDKAALWGNEIKERIKLGMVLDSPRGTAHRATGLPPK